MVILLFWTMSVVFWLCTETDNPSEALTAYINAYEGEDVEREFADKKIFKSCGTPRNFLGHGNSSDQL